jgi:hypothetical protein
MLRPPYPRYPFTQEAGWVPEPEIKEKMHTKFLCEALTDPLGEPDESGTVLLKLILYN